VCVLIPVYYSGDQAEVTMDKMTIGNIADDESFGYASAVMLFVISITCYIVIYYMIKDIWKYMHEDKDADINAVVIEIYGIPKGRDVAELENELKQKLTEKFSDQVKDVIVIPDKAKLYNESTAAEALKHTKENIKAKEDFTGEKSLMRRGCACL
jgi:hypothetical protein